MARDTANAVWDVYDQLRTARLNVKYYGTLAASLERRNFWAELVIAATATGSAIAGFTFWSTSIGRVVWQSLMVIAALLAIAKPLLHLTERLQKLQELISGYRGVEFELRKIEVAIRQRQEFNAEQQALFSLALDHMREVAVLSSTEYSINNSIRRRCQAEVEEELPAEHFFVPERKSND